MLPIINVKEFAADPFTGAAALRFPLEVPPGPGGLAPRLALSYNSLGSFAAQRANYMSIHTFGRGHQSASPYGEGFDLELGQLDLQRVSPSEEIWRLTLLGRGHRLVKIGESGDYHEYRTESGFRTVIVGNGRLSG